MAGIDTITLIWLFPVAFMCHDFEELILGEVWLKKNAARLRGHVPAFIARQVDRLAGKSAAELALPISLIFALTCVAAFLAAVWGWYGFFLAATGLFFAHGVIHVGQAIALRGYVPAVISSMVFVIPYGLVLFPRLIAEGVVSAAGLAAYCLAGAALFVPFLLLVHRVGEVGFRWLAGRLVGPNGE